MFIRPAGSRTQNQKEEEQVGDLILYTIRAVSQGFSEHQH